MLEQAHIIIDSISYIDLIFRSQPNLVMESGVHSSLQKTCHHQTVFCQIQLKSTLPFTIQRRSLPFQ